MKNLDRPEDSMGQTVGALIYGAYSVLLHSISREVTVPTVPAIIGADIDCCVLGNRSMGKCHGLVVVG